MTTTTTLDYNAIAALVKKNENHDEVILIGERMQELQDQLHFAATSILGYDEDEENVDDVMRFLFHANSYYHSDEQQKAYEALNKSATEVA